MPTVGDRARDYEIGRTDINRTFEYTKCPECGYERWVDRITLRNSAEPGMCKKCSPRKRFSGPKPSKRGANNPAWKGGRILLNTGYVRVPMYPEDPLIEMAGWDKKSSHYHVLEHRLVMARHLGRPLKTWEVVHHINGDRQDNRIENLEILPSRQEHMAHTLLQEENRQLRKRISELEKRITLLEAERVLREL